MVVIIPIVDHDLHTILRDDHVDLLYQGFRQVIERACRDHLLVVE